MESRIGGEGKRGRGEEGESGEFDRSGRKTGEKRYVRKERGVGERRRREGGEVI